MSSRLTVQFVDTLEKLNFIKTDFMKIENFYENRKKRKKRRISNIEKENM